MISIRRCGIVYQNENKVDNKNSFIIEQFVSFDDFNKPLQVIYLDFHMRSIYDNKLKILIILSSFFKDFSWIKFDDE